MRISVLSSISILAVFVFAASFFTLREPVTASSGIEIDALAIPTMTHDGLDLTNSTPFLSIPAAETVPVCVLPGNPRNSEEEEFADCLAGYDCENWRKYEDEKNGNIAMVCEDS